METTTEAVTFNPVTEEPVEPVQETKAAGPTRHTHGPNFGRFVAGCPRCIEKQDMATVAAAAPDESVPSGISRRLLEQMKAQLRKELESEMAAKVAAIPAPALDANTLTEAMRVLGTELRRPDPEIEAERAATKLRQEISKQNERQVVAEQAAMVAAEQSACDHKMQNGVSRIRGQVHNDGKYHPFCTWCLKPFEPRVLTQSERSAMGI